LSLISDQFKRAGKKDKCVKEGAEEHRVSMQDFYDSFVEMQRRQTLWDSKIETMLKKASKIGQARWFW
jgi:hypothetical protein